MYVHVYIVVYVCTCVNSSVCLYLRITCVQARRFESLCSQMAVFAACSKLTCTHKLMHTVWNTFVEHIHMNHSKTYIHTYIHIHESFKNIHTYICMNMNMHAYSLQYFPTLTAGYAHLAGILPGVRRPKGTYSVANLGSALLLCLYSRYY